MALKTLKPRLATLNTNKLKILQTGTQRITGRARVDLRYKHFSNHPLCVMCELEGRVTLAQELDHITPLWAGGSESEANRQGLCVPHHRDKTAQEAAQRASGGL